MEPRTECRTEETPSPVEKKAPTSIVPLLVPKGLQSDLHRTCELVLTRGWPGIIWQRGFTGLHLAAKQGSEAAVHLLLHASAAPALNQADCKNMKPIDHAKKKGFTKLLDILDPSRAEDLASGVVPYVEPADSKPAEPPVPKISEAEKQELRDVYARKCKEVEKATIARLQAKYSVQLKTLQAAVEEERRAKTEALEELSLHKQQASASDADKQQLGKLQAVLAKERAEHKQKFQTVNNTLRDKMRESKDAFERVEKIEKDNDVLKAENRELKAQLERLQKDLEIQRVRSETLDTLLTNAQRERTGTGGTLLDEEQRERTGTLLADVSEDQPRRSGASFSIPRTSFQDSLLDTLTVDLTESIEGGVRTQLPSVTESSCNLDNTVLLGTTEEVGQSRVSAAFWEDILAPTGPVITIDRLDTVDETHESQLDGTPYARTAKKRHTIDCEIGELPPNFALNPIEIIGTPVHRPDTTIEVDLTNTLLAS